MAEDNYFLTCQSCESKFELICVKVSYEYDPEYCPFCGSVIDDEDEELDEDDQKVIFD